MRTDKIHAITLRQDGKSYSEISRELGVARSTLSKWFNNIPWSQDVKVANNRRNQTIEKLARLHEKRHEMLKRRYMKADEEALLEYDKYRDDPLFVAGLMLYSGEGDKKLENGIVRVTNSDHLIILIFKHFFLRFCGEYYDRLKIWVLIYPDIDKEHCENWWSDALKMPRDKFNKTIMIKGRHKTNKLQYGVATLIISNKFLKTKILKWVNLASQEIVNRNAGIV